MVHVRIECCGLFKWIWVDIRSEAVFFFSKATEEFNQSNIIVSRWKALTNSGGEIARRFTTTKQKLGESLRVQRLLNWSFQQKNAGGKICFKCF